MNARAYWQCLSKEHSRYERNCLESLWNNDSIMGVTPFRHIHYPPWNLPSDKHKQCTEKFSNNSRSRKTNTKNLTCGVGRKAAKTVICWKIRQLIVGRHRKKSDRLNPHPAGRTFRRWRNEHHLKVSNGWDSRVISSVQLKRQCWHKPVRHGKLWIYLLN